MQKKIRLSIVGVLFGLCSATALASECPASYDLLKDNAPFVKAIYDPMGASGQHDIACYYDSAAYKNYNHNNDLLLGQHFFGVPTGDQWSIINGYKTCTTSTKECTFK